MRCAGSSASTRRSRGFAISSARSARSAARWRACFAGDDPPPADRGRRAAGRATTSGVPRYDYGLAEEQDEVGVATGAAVTSVGGDLLGIEVLIMQGKGDLILTGQLGDVMQESARAALSYARARTE